MSITERFFYLEKEPCVIYLPEKPNGFSVMLLGDYNYFIENGTSLWTQHAGRSYFLHGLIEQGYTAFSSNLYGRHWGNDQSVRLAKRLYDVVLRKGDIECEMHIMADGKGSTCSTRNDEQIP